ncbi:hypothetical protein HWQ46_01740 [Shewanella sp. D64]|uniref:hypothetical protein n=1 Tax=unclassified Shewanella TaxID=196818 RepID=UPI0022BA65F3|nr:MULTISPECIES: hypothetical protein [unclassified Shewanella]MEC4724269.1 hypothetical protein [Shewanella sp. D64]MEC4738781.1 hypothetical protein [Shewanella sp. E94]WBJ97779.1 hypothetical protein HWQ47_12115 [Shewanella sp. MTB7]
MNLLSILGKVGTSILADVIPGGNAILSAVNAFLPSDSKLSDKATGPQIQTAINGLLPEQQNQLLMKQFDVEITEIKEHTNVINALGDVDKTGHSTRPAIAMMMAQIVAFSVVVLVSFLAVAMFNDDINTIKAIGDNWPLVIAILGTPTALLRSYFGMRTKEKQQKYQAVSNTAPTTGIASLLNMWKSK